MDYFTYQQQENSSSAPKIFIHDDGKSPPRPTCIRYSSSLYDNDNSVFNLLSTSVPSPPITPQINVLPSLSLPTNFFMLENKKKRRFSNPASPLNIPKLHVLIVDDNPINLQILSRLLNLHLNQYVQHIELVKSGIKALEILKCRPFDIILMDIDMPILNGVETTKHIRSSIEFDVLPINRKIPIIAVTTNDSVSWKQIYNEIGMNGCISKPINTVELKSTLLRVLELPASVFPSTPQ